MNAFNFVGTVEEELGESVVLWLERLDAEWSGFLEALLVAPVKLPTGVRYVSLTLEGCDAGDSGVLEVDGAAFPCVLVNDEWFR